MRTRRSGNPWHGSHTGRYDWARHLRGRLSLDRSSRTSQRGQVRTWLTSCDSTTAGERLSLVEGLFCSLGQHGITPRERRKLRRISTRQARAGASGSRLYPVELQRHAGRDHKR
jgi:hypothetical protein